MADLPYLVMLSDVERGRHDAFLEVRSFIIKHGKDQVDAFCMQALADMRSDAEHRDRQRRAADAQRRSKADG